MNFRLTILVFVIAGFGLHAQTYVSFPKTNASWNQLAYGPFKWPYEYQYTLEDSTYIESNWYKNVITDYWETFYLREDSVGNVFVRLIEQVSIPYLYLQDYPLNQDLLLYSFNNLQIGDTIQFEYANSHAKVLDIDSVMVANSYRKRYSIEVSNEGMLSFDEAVWIEGIGSTKGLFRLWQYEFEWALSLCEFYNAPSNEEEYSYSPYDCFTNFVEESVNSEVEFFPIPCYNNLEYKSEVDSFFIIVLYDELGKKVLENVSSGGSGSIDMTGLSEGCYILECLSNNELKSRKQIVKLN